MEGENETYIYKAYMIGDKLYKEFDPDSKIVITKIFPLKE